MTFRTNVLLYFQWDELVQVDAKLICHHVDGGTAFLRNI